MSISLPRGRLALQPGLPEGIVRVEELMTLRGLGVGHGQGYLLSRPASISELDLAAVRTSVNGLAS